MFIKIRCIKIKNKSTLLFAFNDPNGKYINLFDGHGYDLICLFRYVTAKKEISLLPDWFYSFEENIGMRDSLWGKTEQEIIINLKKINTKYFLYLNQNEKKFSSKFELIDEWNLKNDLDLFEGVPFEHDMPNIQLFELKNGK